MTEERKTRPAHVPTASRPHSARGLWLGAIPALLLTCCGLALGDDRPNIVFILADDLGYSETLFFQGK